MRHYLTFFLLLSSAARAQAPGVQPAWDLSPALSALIEQTQRLAPILGQLTPAEWVSRGASETFVQQWRGVRQELGYIQASARALEKEPEKLTLALETYFRLEAMEVQLRSLADGVRVYQNPAVADLLVSVMGENSSNRDRLRAHITDVAAQKEQEFAVVDREAQRCRGTLNRAPAQPGPARQPAPAKRPAVKQ
jgi:hypothetical protein